MDGVVKFFNHMKGFGFIKANDSEDEYFVHITDIVDEAKISDDDKVTFTADKDEKGLKAVKVSLLSASEE